MKREVKGHKLPKDDDVKASLVLKNCVVMVDSISTGAIDKAPIARLSLF